MPGTWAVFIQRPVGEIFPPTHPTRLSPCGIHSPLAFFASQSRFVRPLFLLCRWGCARPNIIISTNQSDRGSRRNSLLPLSALYTTQYPDPSEPVEHAPLDSHLLSLYPFFFFFDLESFLLFSAETLPGSRAAQFVPTFRRPPLPRRRRPRLARCCCFSHSTFLLRASQVRVVRASTGSRDGVRARVRRVSAARRGQGCVGGGGRIKREPRRGGVEDRKKGLRRARERPDGFLLQGSENRFFLSLTEPSATFLPS